MLYVEITRILLYFFLNVMISKILKVYKNFRKVSSNRLSKHKIKSDKMKNINAHGWYIIVIIIQGYSF